LRDETESSYASLVSLSAVPLLGLARSRHPDLKLVRLARLQPFEMLRRSSLVTLGSIVDELVFPAGSVLVRGGVLATEALLLLRPGEWMVDDEGTWSVPVCGLTVGLRPWLERGCHPTTVLAGSDVTAYVVAGPAVRLLLETTPAPGWLALESVSRATSLPA
jgi:hypothetical protein